MNEEMDNKHGLAVERVFAIARNLAHITCDGLRERQYISDNTLSSIELYLDVALDGSIESNLSERYRLAAMETREKVNDVLSRGHGIRAGKRIAMLSLERARRTVLDQDRSATI